MPRSAHPLRHAVPTFLLAGFCFISLDATAKWLLVRGHPLLLVVWARFAGQMLFATPFAWHRAGHAFWRTDRLGLQLVRSTLLPATTFCFYLALRYLPLAEGSAIMLLTPIVIVALSGPLLGERPNRWRWITAIAGFVGILIILRPGSAVFHPAAAFLVAAAVFNALYQILTRKLVDEDVSTTLFYSGVVGTLGFTIALPWSLTGVLPHSRDTGLLLLLGVLAGLGHGLMIRAFTWAPASMLTPFTYLQTMWAIGYGYLLFSQFPDGGSAVGMLVIVASGVVLAWTEHRRGRVP